MSKVPEIGILVSYSLTPLTSELVKPDWLFLLQQGCQEFVGIAFLAL